MSWNIWWFGRYEIAPRIIYPNDVEITTGYRVTSTMERLTPVSYIIEADAIGGWSTTVDSPDSFLTQVENMRGN